MTNKQQKNLLCVDDLRHAEYYQMQTTFDDLYSKSKNGEKFQNLMLLILSRENILLAYRNIKSNGGSKTQGTDNVVIDDIGKLSADEYVEKLRFIVAGSKHGYRPKAVRRKEIPKPNGKLRPLESIYAVVFMDAIHYNVRCEGRIVKKAVYIAIGINMDGKKDVLGMYVGENESARYWLSILNGLKNRGVEDILITCVDGLTGFPEAISAVYPKTEVQQCIIHQIRNSTKYVSYKDIKALMADLKKVYAAVDEETALYELEQFAAKWDSKYPKISAS